MDIETRLSNLENLVNALSKKIDDINFYIKADIQGCRQMEGNLSNKDEELSNITGKNTADIDYIAMESGIDLEV